jgi:hypothetical protein
MRETITKVYQFDELSNSAKEHARNWWRDSEDKDFDTTFMYETFETAAKLLGIEFDKQPIKLMGGSTRYEPKIWWSGFSSQGDGASFEGSYSYAKNCSKAIRSEFPTDAKLHAIADGLISIQKANGYKLSAKITQSDRHYCHKYTMRVDAYKGDDEAEVMTNKTILDLMRDFAEWMYRSLEEEYEYRMDDENVDESIRINEYEFTENGEIA